jgi:hypothetical protein
MNLGDDEHITDLPLIAPNAGPAELIEHLFRLENWRRSREPAADGGILPKFVRWRDLVNAKLVTYSNGEINAGGDVFTPITPVVSVAEGGGALFLTVDRFPFFSFPSGTSHVAQAPGETMLTFTAKLLNLTGTATWTAEAFDARSGGASLGTFVLGGAGNTRTMTAAQFVSLGTNGAVRRVRVTATLGSNGAEDFIDVFRQDPTTLEPFLYLSNPSHPVQTDVNGENGNYADAFTYAAVFEGITDTTADWTFSQTPDAGVTSTINGGAGPVANPATVTVAVSDMTVPTGIVLVKATQVGEADLTADFVLNKQEASATGYTAFFTPRQEILLPITDAGVVSTYENAWSDLKIVKNGAIDDTANWTLTKEDVNVTSTLVGAKVTVTQFVGLGEMDTPYYAATLDYVAAGWRDIFQVRYADGVWIAVGRIKTSGTTAYSYVFRSTDFTNWTMVNVGAAGHWTLLNHSNGAWVIARASDVTTANLARRSTDGGLTWSPVTLTTTASTQLNDLVAGNNRIFALPLSATGASQSTDGGATWSALTIPAGGYNMWYGAGIWLCRTSSGVHHISTNNGGSWTNDDANWPIDANTAIEFKGRLVVALLGTNSTARYRDVGGAWVNVALPTAMISPHLVIVKDVLYMLEGAATKLCYSTDGKTWVQGDASSANRPVLSNASIPVDFLPLFELAGSKVQAVPLLATSDTDGAVIVTAVKSGALDIEVTLPVLKGTAPRDAYAFQAQPAYMVLPATSDGVVTSFAGGVMNFFAQKNGTNDTANWSWSWTTLNLTPASGTGPTVTLTDMSQSQDTGYITVTFSKPGQAVRTETLVVQKIRGNLPAGPIVGGAFSAVTTTTTHIALRFNKDGRVQQQVTSGGVWTDLTGWAGRVHATANQGYWLKVILDAGTHALTSGTPNTFLAMTSDRDFVMSDASPAPHECKFKVVIATDSSGANPVIGFGSMTILPP